ncbi:MAG TPA: D-alanyl-D-alanine carboxypeptidase/D-alanyl-D-alanine-endopeptidase [Polyangiaceae bacterium]|nr:D-alanyl-D-alanine carboxypeptidase/D-alanyl-D-alanine-endopeptidase [Polyangiaceae bacterium]
MPNETTASPPGVTRGSVPAAVGRVARVVAAALLAHCHGSSGGSAPAPSASVASSAPTPPSAALPVSAPVTTLPAPPVMGELTTPIAAPVPALREAALALTRKIAEYGGHVGIAVLDVQTGELLAAQNDRRPLNPASNAKLFTAAAALANLHGNYRFETGLYGEIKGANVAKLVLRGHGDPSLVTRDLWDMVQDLKEQGVRRVDGDIFVDQRFFDDNFVPPAFEQQPNEWAYFRAPVSAVALNENTVTMTVRPTAADSPAQVSFDPPGFVDAEGTVKTAAEGHAESVRLELVPNNYRMIAHIGGSIPEKERSVGFTRRVDNPSLLAGYALKALLTASGIAAPGEVKPGGEQVKTLLAMHRSKPLSSLLYELGKASDNFYAEMVFKTLGAERQSRPGKSADGAEVVAKYLKDVGALEEGTVIKNGSGLFDANRVTAQGTVKLLRAAMRDSAISAEYLAQLSIGGVDGTLHKRFRELKDRRSLRAKTGTLESAVALSGYVLAPPGKSPVAFSIMVNGVAGKVTGTRAAVDKCVDVIVRYLWRSN